MKKLIVFLLAPALVAALSSVSLATIVGSAHDLRGLPGARGEICLPCHAPHNNAETVADAPLWNHAVTTAVYTLYTSPTLDAGSPPGSLDQPAGVSKLCLSCHDGTVALDAFGGKAGSIKFGPDSRYNLGIDLRDDHPLSFIYDTNLAAEDGGLFDPSSTPSGIVGGTGTITEDMLFADKVECASCHDVHNEFNNDFLLLKSNEASALCLTCHDK